MFWPTLAEKFLSLAISIKFRQITADDFIAYRLDYQKLENSFKIRISSWALLLTYTIVCTISPFLGEIVELKRVFVSALWKPSCSVARIGLPIPAAIYREIFRANIVN